jgi:hypothetical protein
MHTHARSSYEPFSDSGVRGPIGGVTLGDRPHSTVHTFTNTAIRCAIGDIQSGKQRER